jgi:hypothetical protein
MRSFKALALATALACGLTGVASAAPLQFDPSPYAQARSIINVVFANYIKSLTGIQIESKVVDINGDGKGEIAVRFVHSSSCVNGMKSCRMVLMRHQDGNWKIILDRFAETFDVRPGSRDFPAPILVDKVTWNWDGGRYMPDVSGLGDAVDLKPVPEKTVASLVPAFGAGTSKLYAAHMPLAFSFAQAGLSDAGDVIVVKMEGANTCGKFTGCPVRVLKKVDGKWATVLSASTLGDIRSAKAKRQGLRDIVFETKDGALQVGWTGSKYALADRIEGVAK